MTNSCSGGDYYCDANDVRYQPAARSLAFPRCAHAMCTARCLTPYALVHIRQVGGNFCPEMDVMEANNAAIQTTPHKCVAPSNNWYESCDKGGCAVNSYKVRPTSYGPGATFDIDTTKPFHMSQSFLADATSGNLTSVVTVLSQPGKAGLTMRHTETVCGAGYLAQLSAPLAAGMVRAVRRSVHCLVNHARVGNLVVTALPPLLRRCLRSVPGVQLGRQCPGLTSHRALRAFLDVDACGVMYVVR